MSDLSNCLSTYVPRVIDFPISANASKNPVRWALDFFRANQDVATLQMIKGDHVGTPGTAADSSSAAYEKSTDVQAGIEYARLDNSSSSMDFFLDGIQKGRPLHGRAPVFYATNRKISHRQKGQFLWDIFTSQFLDELRTKSPFGIYAVCNLWLSAGGHRYEPHMDLMDGFLFHLAGNKLLRVWPTPEKYRHEGLYNLEDVEGRKKSEPVEYQLQPGQVAFTPSGAMHWVDARGTEPCVSVSLHMGCVYPLLALRDQLNGLLGTEAVYLPEHMCESVKDLAYYFQPSDFLDQCPQQIDCIPDRLANTLLDVLQSKTLDRDQLRNLLSRWWETSRKELNYQGPEPDDWPL